MKKVSEKEKRRGRRLTIFAIALGAACAAVILALLLPQLAPADRTAVVIGGEKFSLSEFNYYYQTYYDTYCSENEQYLSYMFDTSKSLKTQAYDENQSWFDYFTDQAADAMTGVVAVADKARAAGFALPAADQAEVDTALENVARSAANRSMTSDEYLSGVYGKGMTAERFRRCLTDTRLAKAYGAQVRESFSFTAAELEAQYNQNPGQYALVDYERFYVRACGAGETPTDAQKAAAGQTADEILARVRAGESLKDVSADYSAKGAYTAFSAAYYDRSFSYGDWLFSADRKDGDSAEIDDGRGCYVMVFHAADRGNYASADCVDVAFAADSGADDAQRQYEDACEKAEALQKVWESGAKTAGAAQTAAAQTDGETQTYAELTKNTLDGAIDDWVFDPARAAGDSAVIYTKAGFHAVFYAGAGREAWKVSAENDLREAEYEEWYQALLKGTKVVRKTAVLQSAGQAG